MEEEGPECRTLSLMHVLGKRWTIPVVEAIPAGRNGTSFNAIQQELGTITSKTLSKKLRELSSAGVIGRKEYRDNGASRISYSFTKKGTAVRKFIRNVKELGICLYGVEAGCVNRKCSTCPLSKPNH